MRSQLQILRFYSTQKTGLALNNNTLKTNKLHQKKLASIFTI